MKTLCSAIWAEMPHYVFEETGRCVQNALDQVGRDRPLRVFFRADDVAVPGRNLAELLTVFQRREVPLSLAIVPAWLSVSRWQWLADQVRETPAAWWCWHQHGWRHVNHQATGKKQEFGDQRSRRALQQDLAKGRSRLEQLLGDRFTPVFTPPWNRCGGTALDLLREMDYLAVSRSEGSVPGVEGIFDFPVHVDLHTRRELNPEIGWQNFFQELSASLRDHRICGVMIHHQRMNSAAFTYLDYLLQVFSEEPGIDLTQLGDLVSTRS